MGRVTRKPLALPWQFQVIRKISVNRGQDLVLAYILNSRGGRGDIYLVTFVRGVAITARCVVDPQLVVPVPSRIQAKLRYDRLTVADLQAYARALLASGRIGPEHAIARAVLNAARAHLIDWKGLQADILSYLEPAVNGRPNPLLKQLPPGFRQDVLELFRTPFDEIVEPYMETLEDLILALMKG